MPFIDSDPDLWDKYFPEELREKIRLAQLLYIRKGSCNRCGSCCYWMDKDGIRKPCRHLFYDDEGLSVCAFYSIRPNICRDFPLKPDIINKHPNCSYYFQIREELSKEEATDILMKMCAECKTYDKVTCQRKKDNELEISKKK